MARFCLDAAMRDHPDAAPGPCRPRSTRYQGATDGPDRPAYARPAGKPGGCAIISRATGRRADPRWRALAAAIALALVAFATTSGPVAAASCSGASHQQIGRAHV